MFQHLESLVIIHESWTIVATARFNRSGLLPAVSSPLLGNSSGCHFVDRMDGFDEAGTGDNEQRILDTESIKKSLEVDIRCF